MKRLSPKMIDVLITARINGYAFDGRPTMEALVDRGLAVFDRVLQDSSGCIALTEKGVAVADSMRNFDISYESAKQRYKRNLAVTVENLALTFRQG